MRLYVSGGVAALSDHAMKALVLPPLAQRVRVVADNDMKDVGKTAAKTASWRWTAEGRTLRVSLSKAKGIDSIHMLLDGLEP
jgi:hypothetical protein